MSTLSLSWFAIIGIVIPLFWLTPVQWRLSALSLATLVIVAWLEPFSALILIAITCTTWLYTRGDDTIHSGRATLAIGLPVLILLMIKLASASKSDDIVTGTIVPLGLAFYTLRAVHFSFERYLGRIGSTPFLSIAYYMLFLPTILVGPIHRYPEFERDVRRHRWDSTMLSAGLERILYGAFKIAFLGNFLTWRLFGNFISDSVEPGSPVEAYLVMIKLGLNLYFQFSGASDIAIGFARCLGFRVMENFRWPFLAASLPEFWRRWHISLTSLVREYVFSGISAVSRSPKLAALITMLVIGLWHEISLRYILWGLYHGAGIAVWQAMERRLPEHWPRHNAYKLLGWFVTMHFVFFGFYFVRMDEPLGALIKLTVK